MSTPLLYRQSNTTVRTTTDLSIDSYAAGATLSLPTGTTVDTLTADSTTVNTDTTVTTLNADTVSINTIPGSLSSLLFWRGSFLFARFGTTSSGYACLDQGQDQNVFLVPLDTSAADNSALVYNATFYNASYGVAPSDGENTYPNTFVCPTRGTYRIIIETTGYPLNDVELGDAPFRVRVLRKSGANEYDLGQCYQHVSIGTGVAGNGSFVSLYAEGECLANDIIRIQFFKVENQYGPAPVSIETISFGGYGTRAGGDYTATYDSAYMRSWIIYQTS